MGRGLGSFLKLSPIGYLRLLRCVSRPLLLAVLVLLDRKGSWAECVAVREVKRSPLLRDAHEQARYPLIGMIGCLHKNTPLSFESGVFQNLQFLHCSS